MSFVAKLALSPLLVAQGLWTRRRVPVLAEAAGPRDGEVGVGPPLQLLIVGDSSAAGVGVTHQDQALAGHLTRTLAAAARVRVHWRLVARSGVTSARALDLLRDAAPCRATWRSSSPASTTWSTKCRRSGRCWRAPRWPIGCWRKPARAMSCSRRCRRCSSFRRCRSRCAGLPAPMLDATTARWRRGPQRGATSATCRSACRSGLDNMASDGFHPGEPVYRVCGEALAAHIERHVLAPRRAIRFHHDGD